MKDLNTPEIQAIRAQFKQNAQTKMLALKNAPKAAKKKTEKKVNVVQQKTPWNGYHKA